MTERVRQKPTWSSLNRFEQMALVSSILIWIGVLLFGGGLYIAFRNFSLTQTAYAQATAIAETATAPIVATTETNRVDTETVISSTETTLVPTETPTPTPTPTTQVFPAGWSTATPAPTTTPTQTRSLTATPQTTQQSVPQPASAPQKPKRPAGPPPAAGPPERLVIPAIELDSTVIPVGWHVIEDGGSQYSIWQVADDAVGWHNTTVYPGHAGNIVLNGHHNIQGQVFRYLVDVEVGDQILVHTEDRIYHYAVAEKHILKEKGEPPEVRQKNAKWIAPTQEERLTMVTCWPYTNNTHRLVVVAKPAPAPTPVGYEEWE
jgi:sortase A